MRAKTADLTPIAARVRELFQRAVGLIRATHLIAAKDCLDELLCLEAHHADALAFRGWIHALHQRRTYACADLEAALLYAPPGWPRRAEVELQLASERAEADVVAAPLPVLRSA